MTLPSKELFEAVKCFAVNGDTFKVNDKIIHYDYLDHKGQYQHTCTINDFFFEVKEWALKQKQIELFRVDMFVHGNIYVLIGINNGYEDDFMNQDCENFKAPTEQEAAFKAAEWILNQQDKGI